jgi:putative protease
LVSKLEAQPIENSTTRKALALLEEQCTVSQHHRLIPSLHNDGTQNIDIGRMPRGIGILPMIQETPGSDIPTPEPALTVLCRTQEQFDAALTLRLEAITLDFEDIRRCGPAIASARSSGAVSPATKIFVASPRIIKASEGGLLGLLEKSGADGFLVRNASAIARLKESGRPLVGDFSLNIANALSAAVYQESGLMACAPSFDLNADQLCDLVASFDPRWFEVVIHQHIPMFHMEHCVFAAFLSEGTDYTNCGRPCEKHRVTLRDRVGQQHPLLADVGCRNTLFNGRAQSGAGVFHRLRQLGVTRFRIDLLDESANQVRQIVEAYRALAAGSLSPEQLFDRVQAARQLGVTGGTLTVLNR